MLLTFGRDSGISMTLLLPSPLLFFSALLVCVFFSQVDLLSFCLPCYSFPCFLLPLFSFFSLFFFSSSMPLPFIEILSFCLSSMIVIRPGFLCFGRIGTPTVLPSLDCWWWFPPRLNGLLWRLRTWKINWESGDGSRGHCNVSGGVSCLSGWHSVFPSQAVSSVSRGRRRRMQQNGAVSDWGSPFAI